MLVKLFYLILTNCSLPSFHTRNSKKKENSAFYMFNSVIPYLTIQIVHKYPITIINVYSVTKRYL